MIISKFKKGDIVRGTEAGSRYYKNGGVELKKAKVLDVEERSESIMIIVEILEHSNKKLITGNPIRYNQTYFETDTPEGMVMDVDGNLIKEEEAITISGRFYTPNVNAFLVNEKWYSANGGTIEYDAFLGGYDKHDNLISGFAKNKTSVYFSQITPYVKVILNPSTDSPVYYISKADAEADGYMENEASGYYYLPEDSRVKNTIKISYNSKYAYDNIEKALEKTIKENRICKELLPIAKEKIKMNAQDLGKESPTFRITNGVKYTFGVELETSKGILDKSVAFDQKLNIGCVHDGSISGGEIVTGILKGDKGFENLNRVTSTLSKRASIDSKCGLHVHIGGANFNKNFIVYSYMLAKALENEMDDIMPYSRKFVSKNKYCKRMPDIDFGELIKDRKYLSSDVLTHYMDKYYKEIYKIVGNGNLPSEHNNRLTKNSGGRWCKGRYMWFNLVPTCFLDTRSNTRDPSSGRGRNANEYDSYAEQVARYIRIGGKNKMGIAKKRGAGGAFTSRINADLNDLSPLERELFLHTNITPMKKGDKKLDMNMAYTVEFRNHSPSFNYDKIKNWVLICMAFVKFVEDNQEFIINNFDKSIKISNLVDNMFGKDSSRAKTLNSYITMRKKKFSNTKTDHSAFEKSDLVSKKETLKSLCVQ